MLEKEELQRYSRQIMLPELGTIGQHKLKQGKVLMIGAGGLGCPVLQYLVAAGVGTIGIVDNDVVDITNLHRQILYNLNDVGMNKALVAKEKLQLMNPNVNIKAYQERLTGDNCRKIFEQYDLVIDGSDNFPTRYLVNENCVALQKPLVFGSIFKFEGQVSVFNYNHGPNYLDLFPEAPDKDEVPNCSEIGVIGVLPGIVGTFMANEAVKILCGIGEVLSGRLLTIDALNCAVNIFEFSSAKEGLNAKKTTAIFANDIEEVDLVQLRQWLADTPDEFLLIDVRDDYEFDAFNIGGLNIPLYELPERSLEIPLDKTVVFCCASGHRSKQAVILFKHLTERRSVHLSNGLKILQRL